MYHIRISLRFLEFADVPRSDYDGNHSTFTCSKSKMETPKQGVKSV